MSGPIPTDSELTTLTCPVLVLHSTDDRAIPHAQADATARPYADATVTRVDGIGHIPVERQWLEVADATCAFLSNPAVTSAHR